MKPNSQPSAVAPETVDAKSAVDNSSAVKPAATDKTAPENQPNTAAAKTPPSKSETATAAPVPAEPKSAIPPSAEKPNRFAAAGKFIWRKVLKRFVKITAIVLAVALLLSVCALIFIEPLLKYTLNNSVDYLDLEAKVDSVEVHYLTQTLAIRGITLMNPPGFIQKEAMHADKLEVRFNFPNFKNPIRRIYLQNPKIRLEGKFGKRILAPSIRSSNLFVIAREVANIMGVDLEQMTMKTPEDSDKSALANLDAIEESAGKLESVGRVRVDNLRIENGMKDIFNIGSIILQKDTFEICDVSAFVCGVDASMKNIFFDLPNEKIACTKLIVKNPPNYPNAHAVSAGRMSIQFGDKEGTKEPCISKITIDSPTIRFEDKTGSMLGALGIENNFATLSKSISMLTDADVSNLYNDDFEIEIHDKTVNIPKLDLNGVEINNTTVTCSYNDGFKIGRIGLDKSGISVDGIRMNLAKIKARMNKLHVDYDKNLCTASGIALRNPAGFPEENAFLMNELSVATSLRETNIRGNRVLEIDSVRLKDFFVRLDSRTGDLMDLLGVDNNLLSLIADFNDAAKFIPAYQAAMQQKINEDRSVRPRRYIIHTLILEGGEIRLGPRGDAVKLPMETIVLSNVGLAEGGLMSDEIVTLLIREIAIRAMNAAEEQLPTGWAILQPVIKALKAIVNMVM